MDAICGAKVPAWKQLCTSPQQHGMIKEGYWQGCQLWEVSNSLGRFQSRSSHLGLGLRDCIFLDELARDVRELDANIFRIKHRNVQIEVLEINGAELSSFLGEDTVELELDEFKQGCVGAHIAWIANPVAANGDTGAIRIILFKTNLTNDHGVADFLALVGQDVLEINDVEMVLVPATR